MRKLIPLIIFPILLTNCKGTSQNQSKEIKAYPFTKTDAEWKADLSEMAYYVLRQAGTERAFTGALNGNYESGTYVCGGCQKPLYLSEHKFDSGTGWPSFDRGVEENLEYDVDHKIGYARTEVKCNNCGGHLGHVFNDGPKTTGKRHCINSTALNFIPKDE